MTSARRQERPSRERRSAAPPQADPIADAVRFLAHGDRSEGQVERRLTDRGYPAKVVRTALMTLRRFGYVNDDAVALRVAQARLTRHPMGREALTAELKAREFSDETVTRAVGAAFAGTTEQAVAESFLMSLPPRYTDLSRESRRRAGLLRGRGFSADVIETVLGSKVHDENAQR